MRSCRTCGAGPPLASPRYCPACLDARVDEIIVMVMKPLSDKNGRPRGRPRSRPGCLWCGDNLPCISGKKFCGRECMRAFRSDLKLAGAPA